MKNLLADFFNHTPIVQWIFMIPLALTLERISRGKQLPSMRDKFLNLGTGFVTCLMYFIVVPFTKMLVYAFGSWMGTGFIDLRLFPHHDFLSQLLSVLLFMLIEDFFYYFYHRAAHTIPFFWDIHAVHHSDPAMAAMTALRRHWLETPLQEMLVSLPVALFFKLTPIEIGLLAFGRSFFVFFAHLNVNLDLGKYSWVITGPQLHRLHHSILPEHWDSNYAQIFPIFDRIFGTYVAPRPGEYPPTGLASKEQVDTMAKILLWPFGKWARRMGMKLRRAAS